LAAKQQSHRWLSDLQAQGWRLVKSPECVHMDDGPGLCWRRGGAWFDSPHEHERRCHDLTFINDLMKRNSTVLDTTFYKISAAKEERCLRYRRQMNV
jgi:hypothetical protein